MSNILLAVFLVTAPGSVPTPATPIPVLTEDDDVYWNDIVPGEVIVFYKNVLDKKNLSLKSLGINKKGVTLQSIGLDNRWIVVKVEGGIPEERAFIKTMKTKSEVKFVEPNRKYKPAFTPNDTYWSSYQWDKRALNADKAWDYGLGDTSIAVGILDMGVSYTHPDLAPRFAAVKGYDFFDSDGDPINASSSEWHATHCAGIACATINNGMGIAGMANCRLYSLRFMSATDGGDYVTLSNSIIWCINNGVRVLSISAIGPHSNTVATYCLLAWNAGRLLFAATGNNSAEVIYYPAGDSGVLAIGGMNQSGGRLYYSNYGSHVKFVAPGEDIYSTYPGNTYSSREGTSMACPGAAGGAALVWSMKPSLTNAQLRDILISTTTDISPAGWDKYTGYGKFNLEAAVLAAIAVEENPVQKLKFDISPNPATSFLTINLYLPTSQNVSLKIFNSAGKEVKTIIEENKQAGDYNTIISTHGLSSGIYFAKLKGEGLNFSKKITLIR